MSNGGGEFEAVDRPTRPPASASSVAPRGKRTKAESPCPTSMNDTCRRPSPPLAAIVHGSASIQTAEATRSVVTGTRQYLVTRDSGLGTRYKRHADTMA